ncbi:histone H4-like [Heterodontus francisci]|uniref:histone H4-like n=1 Tax=Heterodontus francisci TaxID=7792 RepID=UPI00355BD414
METLKDAKLHDVFSKPADGAQHRHTWSTSDGKDAGIRVVTIPGSGGTQVQISQYMDDVAVFSLDPLSVRRLMSICNQKIRTGRGKGGKRLGKGRAKQHRKVLHDNIQGITKPAIRCLARHGGVQCIMDLIYEEIRGLPKVFLENVIRDAVTYTELAKRKMITTMDVVYALKCQGCSLYGFGG